jgi:hypothetical protein
MWFADVAGNVSGASLDVLGWLRNTVLELLTQFSCAFFLRKGHIVSQE